MTSIDYGTDYLAKVLAYAVRVHLQAGGSGKIGVYDPDQQVFEPTLENIAEAAGHASQVDGFVTYRVGGATFQVLYDGPYEDWPTGEEIIQDCNDRASFLMNAYNDGPDEHWPITPLEKVLNPEGDAT